MTKVVLAFLIFLVIAWRNAKKKHSWLTPSSVLICIYTFSLLMAVVDIMLNPEFTELVLRSYYWKAATIMTVMLIAFLGPFLFFDESKVERIKLPNIKILDIFSTIIIFLSIFSISFYAPTVLQILQGDLGALRDALYAGGEAYFEEGIVNTIASVGSSFYVFALLLFFIYVCIGGSKMRIALLFISSLSNIVHVLAFVGRDGVVYWIFAFCFLFCLFRPYLHLDTIKRIKKMSLIFGVILIIPFMMISVSRFKEGMGAGNSIVHYMGQPYIYGTLYFGIDNPPVSIGQAFPLFYEFTGIPMPEDDGGWEEGGTVSYVFGTFLKSLYSSLGGYFGLIFLCILSGFFFMIKFGKSTDTLAFSNLFIYILYFEVLAQGVFYFRQYTRGGNLFILLCLLFAFTFSIIQKSSSTYLTKVSDE